MTVKILDEGIPWGVYIAYSRGRKIVNEEYSPLVIPSRRGDQKKINELIHVAKSFGLDEITVKFEEGVRMISNEEHEEQIDRLKNGEHPDPYEPGNLRDMVREYNYKKEHGLL